MPRDDNREPYEDIEPKVLRQARALSTKRLRTGWPRQAVLQDLQLTHGFNESDANALIEEITEKIKGLPIDTRALKGSSGPSKLQQLLKALIALALLAGAGYFIYTSVFKNH